MSKRTDKIEQIIMRFLGAYVLSQKTARELAEIIDQELHCGGCKETKDGKKSNIS